MRRVAAFTQRVLNTPITIARPVTRRVVASTNRTLSSSSSSSSSTSLHVTTRAVRQMAVAGMLATVALTSAIVYADHGRSDGRNGSDGEVPKEQRKTPAEMKAELQKHVAELRLKAKSGKADDIVRPPIHAALSMSACHCQSLSCPSYVDPQ
jgi:hypothetical protein